MYMSAFAPTADALQMYLLYEQKRREIEKTDYTKKLSEPDEVLATTAAYIGLSVREYKQKLANTMKEKDIEKLKEKYGFLTEDEREAIARRKKEIDTSIGKMVNELKL